VFATLWFAINQGARYMKGFRSFVAGLLLVPVLAFAGPLGNDVDVAGLSAEKSVAGTCYVYYMGRWIIIPC
jgi:hypothetical protein